MSDSGDNWFRKTPYDDGKKRTRLLPESRDSASGSQTSGSYRSPWGIATKPMTSPQHSLLPRNRFFHAKTPTELPEEKQGLSAQVVMHQFARSQVRELSKGYDELYHRVVDKLCSMPEFENSKLSDDFMSQTIKFLTFRLQNADLTINLDASKWFNEPNNYLSYTQMYERGTSVVIGEGGKKEMLLAGNSKNSPDARDAADTRVTFPPNITSKEMQGVARFMTTGGVTADGDTFKINNGQFNPKSRQIFAGLNYGRRAHGSTTEYGKSHLILKDNLKDNAIYYMGDSFDVGVDASKRVTYGTLFALILYGTKNAVKDIMNSCYRQIQLESTKAWDLLVEAHIYGQVQFSQDVKKIVISQSELSTDPEACKAMLENIRDFGSRNKIGVDYVA